MRVSSYPSTCATLNLSDNVTPLQAKRTPFGTFGGKLKHLSATDLAVLSSKAAIKDAKVRCQNYQ
jgi:acetyl-CoA acyltransferase 2